MIIKKFHQLFESYSDYILDIKRVVDNFMDVIACELRISKGLTLRDKHGVLILSKSTDSNVQGDISESGLLPVFSYGYTESTSFHINTNDYTEYTGNFLYEHEDELQELQNRLTTIFDSSDHYDIDIAERFIRIDIYEQIPKPTDTTSKEWIEICSKIKEFNGVLNSNGLRNKIRNGINFNLPIEHEDIFFEFLSQYETDVPDDHLMMDKHKACKISNSGGKDLILMFNAEDYYGGFLPEPTSLTFKVTSNDANLSLYCLIDSLEDVLK